jgi:DNA polymerase I-like protein with 3'-5' exonuclease and polymerase domains
MLVQLHDELLFEVHKEDLPQVASLVKAVMESTNLEVVTPVKLAVGVSWGSLTPYHCT